MAIGIGYNFLVPHSLEEELALPETVKKTRNNKVEMVHDLVFISRYADWLADRVKRIPEEDDPHHAELVQNLQHLVRTAYREMDRAYSYNG